MIRKPRSYLTLIFAICLASCAPNVVTTPTNVINPSPVLVSPTFTIVPTETETPTPPATLTPSQADEKIRTYLQELVDCPAPCFWGITPEQTTLNEATNIFASFGLELEQTNARNDQEFYATN